jgi:ATPase subunit of ABC transporter with duplicated ATPase domains
MAGTLIARDIHKAYGDAAILAGVSVTVAPGDVLGVVGPNGAGKSTLLRLLAGLDRPDRGSVRMTAGSAGYLPQEPDRAAGERLHDYLARRTGVGEADARVHAATEAMAAHAPGAAERYADAFERWLSLGGADLGPRAEAVLRDLGLDPALLDLETAALSGGQAARAALAAILLSRFDLLLLDEPTNDLDFDGLARLERFVAARPGGAVIVSHDRAFLERTVTRVLELDEVTRTAAEYGGGWAGYLDLRATAARHAEERYDAYSTERDRLVDRGRRQRQWSETGVRKAKASAATDPDKIGRSKRAERSEKQAAKVRATEKALERLDAVDKPWRRWELQLRFGGGERSGDVTVRLDRAVMRRGSFALGPLDLELAWGERVALVGPNGSGKTTLVDALLGRLDLASGTRWIGPGVRTGTLDQARAGFTGGALLGVFVEQSGLTVQEARSLLAKFGLESDAVSRAASSLSPGERTRASLALLMASGANFLILDEPTNHLDLPAIEQLETALNAYDGTLLLVTHDRQLLDAVSIDRTIELSGAKV